MTERKFEVFIGAVVFDTTDGTYKPFFNVGLHYTDMKDAQRQLTQDYLAAKTEDIAEASAEFVEDLNDFGGKLLGNDPEYVGGSKVLQELLTKKPRRNGKRRNR